MRKPNFFILGAPKCGTTSLAAWLAKHPNIFLSPTKEPHFFNTDDRQGVTTLDGYEDLFRDARDHHSAIGEASVWYLSSSKAVRNILIYQPEARFIVMLRNPVEMAPALHAEMLLSGHENVRDFRAAWNLREERRQGRQLPAFGWARRRLLYDEICALGAQLERLLSAVPARRVLPLFLDDLADDPRREYLKAMQFLEVEDDGRADFPVYNRSRVPRWPRLTRLLFIILELKGRAGIDLKVNLWNRVSDVNNVWGPRPLPSPETEAMLRAYFAPDVELVSRLLGRDLRRWLG